MLPGSITSTDVREYLTTVLVNGEEKPVISWSVDRELTGDLPQAVASVGAVTQATGSIEWAPSWAEHVGTVPANPMNPSTGWVPQPGDRVQIYVTIDGTSYPRFTGRIDGTSGSLAGGMSSTLVDDIDNLNVEYEQESIWDKMPDLPFAGPQNIKCGPMHTLISAARVAGYWNRRKPVGAVASLALLQSGTWPTIGGLYTSQDGQISGGFPTFHDTGDNGWVASDVYAEYAMTDNEPQVGDLWQQSMYVDPTHTSPARAEAYAGGTSSDPYVLRVTGSRVIEALHGTTVLGTLSMAAGDMTATLRWGGGQVVIATESQSATFTATDITDQVNYHFVTANMGARISNVSLSTVTASDPLIHPDEPNLIVDCSTTFVANGRSVLRSIEDRSVRDVLGEISTALLLGIHFSTTGKLVIRSTDRITGAGLARTLTLRDDIFDLDWETNFLSHRSRVRVGAEVPVINLSHDATFTLAQGNETQMNNGDTVVDSFQPAADEEWLVHGLNEADESMAGTNALGHGSWAGASVTSDDGESWSWGVNYFSFTHEQPNYRTHLVVQTASNLPSGSYLSTRATENSTTTTWDAYQGMALPILRGSITKFYGGSVRLAAGPIGGLIEHEVGHWHDWRRFETGSTVHAIADWIKAYVSAPNPEIKSVDIMPDPRLELADLLTADADSHGFTATGPCVGISEGASAGGYDMSIHLRVTTIETTWMTYDQWNEMAGTPVTYDQWNAITTQSYDDFTTTIGDPQ